jgi:small neutral amino acid transporter SnatA (MarC family)
MSKINLKRVGLSVICFLLVPFAWPQAVADSSATTIDDTMRSHDKIYVVMAVCVVILIVFFLYLLRIDRKVSKKEKSL